MRENRQNDETREILVELNYTGNPDGSVMISFGKTKVLCTAMVEEKVPFFLKGKNQGWLSCEYSMLPGSTLTRKLRDRTKGKIDGRSQEIQRLIGRSLRAAIDLKKLGERTIWIDCDVISADGGTRTTSINGAYLALKLAIDKLWNKGVLKEYPIINKVGAISVGTVKGEKLLDLQYTEDSQADVDMNVVMDGEGQIVEIQGTAEGKTFSRKDLNEFLDLAEKGINDIFKKEDRVLMGDKKNNNNIILSTDNINKVKEIEKILKDADINIISKSEAGFGKIEVEENGETLEENAKLKAVAIKEKTEFGVLADDTGLFVNTIDGEPGIHSARYSGNHDDRANREKLLLRLKNKADRSAYFKTVIIYIDENNEKHLFEGICKGKIAEEMRGSAGFGYDSLFIPEGYNKTFAELGDEEKNKISHRSKALVAMKDYFLA